MSTNSTTRDLGAVSAYISWVQHVDIGACGGAVTYSILTLRYRDRKAVTYLNITVRFGTLTTQAMDKYQTQSRTLPYAY